MKKILRSIALSSILLLGCAEPIDLAEPVDLGLFDELSICKAIIATVMGRSPSIIKVDYVLDNVIFLSYLRPDDNTFWAYRCMLVGSTGIWATDFGRWRTDPDDSKITFSVEGNSLKITDLFSDGSANIEYFSLERLGR